MLDNYRFGDIIVLPSRKGGDWLTLKEARINAGFTLARLAEMVGVSPAALQRYETGKRTPNTQTAKRIGEVLEIPWYVVIDNKRT